MVYCILVYIIIGLVAHIAGVQFQWGGLCIGFMAGAILALSHVD